MDLGVRIPDRLAARLIEGGNDLERRALEALALEEYRAGRLTKKELRQVLSLKTLKEFDGF